MIDTVILSLPNYTITDHDKFTPSTRNIDFDRFGGQAWIKYAQNPTEAEKLRDGYKPNLTITKRITNNGIIKPLKIQFSAPKLLFGNNFDELTENDFSEIIEKLELKLKDMGVLVFRSQLLKAKVTAIHFGKNIPFSDYTTSTSIIRELAKIDLTKKLDLTRTKFQNEGHSLQYYTNSFSVVFYDKMKDLQLPKGRAVEKDRLQLNIFDYLENKKSLEVLRLEVRLCTSQKIKRLFKDLNLPDDLTFEAVFKETTAKKVISHYWQEILSGLDLIRFSTVQPVDLLEGIIKSNKLNLKTALSYFGALTLINDIGARKFRQVVNDSYSDRTWQRLKKQLNGLQSPPEGKYKPFATISEVIDRFEPLKMKDLENTL